MSAHPDCAKCTNFTCYGPRDSTKEHLNCLEEEVDVGRYIVRETDGYHVYDYTWEMIAIYNERVLRK